MQSGLNPKGVWGGGCSRFQMTGMIEGYFFLNFRFLRLFWVRNVSKYLFVRFGLSRDFFGIQNNLKIRGSAPGVVLGDSAWDFFGVNFWSPLGICLGFVGSPRDSLGFSFFPHSSLF